MYPLGLLFGLRFDTATGIGLLGISAAEASKGQSTWSILVFPALFTARISLADTSDGVLMGKGIDPEEGCRRRGEYLVHSATLWYSG
jgi:high-affinity nickel permease